MNKVYQTYFPTDPPARVKPQGGSDGRPLHRGDHDGRMKASNRWRDHHDRRPDAERDPGRIT